MVNYLNKEERIVNGMYYIRSFNNTQLNELDFTHKKWYLVMTPEHNVVKPAMDYLIFLYYSGKTQATLKRVATSISHYYNFLKVFRINGSEVLTSSVLEELIKFLAVLPKELKSKLRGRNKNKPIEPWDIKYLPVHPYVSSGGMKNIISILQEWFFTYWNNGKCENVTFFINPKSYHFDEDEADWRYPFEYIKETIDDILDFLNHLSINKNWKHRFKPIPTSVTKKLHLVNKHNNEPYTTWDVNKRIKKVTGLKESKPKRKKIRILFESELRKLLNSKMLNGHTQRRLLFVILLLSGGRISEILNLLANQIRVSIPSDALTLKEKKLKAIINWEDLFTGINNFTNDIIINEHLEFVIRIAKRRAYEVPGVRANKSSETRFVTLTDYFDLPKLLDLNCESITVTSQEIINHFRDDIILENMEECPEKFIPKIIQYHKEQKIKGIHINDQRYDHLYKNWVMRIRSLLDNCWLGNLLKEYLVERELLLRKVTLENKIVRNYLFLNLRNNKGFPIIPNTVREYWFNVICEQEGIDRYGIPVNELVTHYKKGDITVHSLRHTYISMRINLEGLKGDFNRINLANLKKDVGHVPSSEVAETIYYFANSERKTQVYTNAFKQLKENLSKVVFLEKERDES
ncbi:hypothetical protein [Bacillus sp. PS06]|uniref:hypothetical protein n=1 Tax=Bacillus sp. PS06 TaxID=2764176 RepID=UPI001782F8FC|nr:hypothetical protein [Bacillus sp. PS06]MBD8069303.1 hypothetical protein [Bacillus sp. PS06]